MTRVDLASGSVQHQIFFSTLTALPCMCGMNWIVGHVISNLDPLEMERVFSNKNQEPNGVCHNHLKQP